MNLNFVITQPQKGRDLRIPSLIDPLVAHVTLRHCTQNSLRVECDPTFIYIGCGHCGSTSLYDYLNLHPNLEARVKETHFFDDLYHSRYGPPAVRLNFETGTKKYAEYRRDMWLLNENIIYGDMTPANMESPDAPALVQMYAPHARFIIMLEDPVIMCKKMADRNDLIAALRTINCSNDAMDAGACSQSIHVHSAGPLYDVCAFDRLVDILHHNWLQRFSRERFLFVASETLFAQPVSVLHRIALHIGLSTSTFHWSTIRRNVSVVHNAHPKNSRYHYVLPSDLHRKLVRIYRPHVKRLERLLSIPRFPWPSFY